MARTPHHGWENEIAPPVSFLVGSYEARFTNGNTERSRASIHRRFEVRTVQIHQFSRIHLLNDESWAIQGFSPIRDRVHIRI